MPQVCPRLGEFNELLIYERVYAFAFVRLLPGGV